MFLDEDNLVRLTGYRRPRAQCRWLAARGFPFELNGVGLPIVLKSCVESRLGGKPVKSKAKPNFAALQTAKCDDKKKG